MKRWRWATGWIALALLPLVGTADVAPRDAAGSTPVVAQVALVGPIGPAAAEYFDDAVTRATTDGAAAIVLRMDTPGGLSESMRLIIARMLDSKLPVLAYVAPGGARAASAGTYILYAAQIAAMAPATHVGAATPIQLSGNTRMPVPLPANKPAPATSGAATSPAADEADAEQTKTLNDAIATIRSLAQLRGRNAEWAETAARGAATLTADEAVRKHVVDFVARDVADLLAQADGRQVEVRGAKVTLHLRGATVRDYAPGARTQFLAIITNPTIAYLLLLAGIFGIGIEALHPGALLPGIVGGICLLVGLYALQLLPVNYAGLALMALGIGLLVAEALNPTVGVLGIGGVISFVVGSVMLMNTTVPGYAVNVGVIAAIALAAAGLLGAILWLVLRSRRSQVTTGDEGMLTDVAELLEPVVAGGESWALVRGERWRVRSTGALPAGARVRVVRRDGLLLQVVPAETVAASQLIE
jgi:membrane-bound serine protease (ClpP class)